MNTSNLSSTLPRKAEQLTKSKFVATSWNKRWTSCGVIHTEMESVVNESMNGSFTENDQQLSPYAIYFNMTVLILGTPTVIFAALLMIYIIMKKSVYKPRTIFFSLIFSFQIFSWCLPIVASVGR